MNPTVSERIAFRPDGKSSRRIVGSRVAKSRSSAADLRACQPIEKRRFAGVGVPDQRHYRVRHAPARLAVQPAGSLDVVQLAAQPGDALADQPAVDFELALARSAEKAETAALAFEMGPGAHEPRALVRQRRELDLQAAFMRARARAENLEYQAGAVDDLRLASAVRDCAAAPGVSGASTTTSPAAFSAIHARAASSTLPRAEQGRRRRARQPDDLGATTSRSIARAKPDRLVEARFERTLRRFRAAARLSISSPDG